MARVLSHQGYNSLARGDDVDAQNSFVAALRLTREGGFIPFAQDALVGLASLQAKQGDMQQALKLVLIILNDPASSQETQDRAERLRVELIVQLTRQMVEVAHSWEQAKTFEAAVDEVLKQADLT